MILFGQNKKHSSEFFFFFCMCMYIMVVKITKETWGKCGIKTLTYHNKEEKINCGIKQATLKYDLGIQILLLCLRESENIAAK